MRRCKIFFAILIMSALCLTLVGCDKEQAQTEEESKPQTPYEEYIHAALDAVNTNPADEVVTPTPNPMENGKVVHVKDDDDYLYAPDASDVPGNQEVLPAIDEMPTFPADESFSADESSFSEKKPEAEADALNEVSPTPEPTPTGTPETFDVGVCCIYIKCDDESGFGSEVVTAINEARADLGYPELVENEGLATCANRRTREVATYLSHTRPNKEPFYSLAPEYFKAEMLGIGKSKSDATFDAWMTDPESRDLIFTTKYGSIGAHCIKVNDFYCVVVAFGD